MKKYLLLKRYNVWLGSLSLVVCIVSTLVYFVKRSEQIYHQEQATVVYPLPTLVGKTIIDADNESYTAKQFLPDAFQYSKDSGSVIMTYTIGYPQAYKNFPKYKQWFEQAQEYYKENQ